MVNVQFYHSEETNSSYNAAVKESSYRITNFEHRVLDTGCIKRKSSELDSSCGASPQIFYFILFCDEVYRGWQAWIVLVTLSLISCMFLWLVCISNNQVFDMLHTLVVCLYLQQASLWYVACPCGLFVTPVTQSLIYCISLWFVCIFSNPVSVMLHIVMTYLYIQQSYL